MDTDDSCTQREDSHFALNTEACFANINYCSFASVNIVLNNVCMVVLVIPQICKCQVLGSSRWKKTVYVQTFSVLTVWDGIGSMKILGCVWTLGSVQYVGIMAGLLATVPHSPTCMYFLLLLFKNTFSPKEILLRKDDWIYYYKKDVYSKLNYAQIIHWGSNHSFSLPPR